MPFASTETTFDNFSFVPTVTVWLDQTNDCDAVVRGTVVVVTGSADGVGYRRGAFEACRDPEPGTATHSAITEASIDFLTFMSKV